MGKEKEQGVIRYLWIIGVIGGLVTIAFILLSPSIQWEEPKLSWQGEWKCLEEEKHCLGNLELSEVEGEQKCCMPYSDYKVCYGLQKKCLERVWVERLKEAK